MTEYVRQEYLYTVPALPQHLESCFTRLRCECNMRVKMPAWEHNLQNNMVNTKNQRAQSTVTRY